MKIKRFVSPTIALIALLALILPGFVYAGGGNSVDSRSDEMITWSDAPFTIPLRHAGDAQVRWGTSTEKQALGPFEQDGTLQVGDRTRFILGTAPDDSVIFELHHISQHAYFWFQPAINVNPEDLRLAAERFDQEIWELMGYIYGGSIPVGIDGDPRIHLVHMQDFFPSLAGFFSPDDQCANAICTDSNERDALYLMLDYGPVNSKMYLATLAHEFQHLVQFHTDGNEYRWLDEGVSQLIEHLNGFTTDPINTENVRAYLRNPNHTLNAWSIEYGGQTPYYGAGYLFTMYLYERLGLDFIRALVQEDLDGLAAVYQVLETTGQTVTLNDLAADWHTANYLDDPYVSNGQYYYITYHLPTTVVPQTLTLQTGQASHRSDLNQYGAEYLHLTEPGQYEITFEGQPLTPLVGTVPYSGESMWWSYNATASATSLTRTVDLTAVDAATLRYRIWYETGDFPGYLHVMVSEDGERWTALAGKHTVERGQRYNDAPGHHYAGQSGPWKQDVIDLSDYAGQEVQIRFEYITNNAVTGPGVVLDDIEIPELNWQDDAETLDDGWEADGFLRTGQMVQQDWRVRAILGETEPQLIDLTVTDGQAQDTITVTDEGAVIQISAMAPFTQEPGRYQLTVRRVN